MTAQIMIFVTYYYVSQSKVHLNSGIISSIFSSTIIYSILLFYLIYGQTVDKNASVGIVLILIQVVLISLSENSQSVEFLTSDFKCIHQAVACALIVGFTFTLNLLTIKMVQDKFNFPPLQLNYDMNLIYGLILLPFFVFDVAKNGLYSL